LFLSPTIVVQFLLTLGLAMGVWYVHDRVHPPRSRARPWQFVKRATYTALPIFGILLAIPSVLDSVSEEVWATGRVADMTMYVSDPITFRVELQGRESQTAFRVPDEVAHRLEVGDQVEVSMKPRLHRTQSLTILQGAHLGYHWENPGSGAGDIIGGLLAMVWLPVVLFFWGAFMLELAIPGLAELSQALWRRARKASA
jgi:hypothetical protein